MKNNNNKLGGVLLQKKIIDEVEREQFISVSFSHNGDFLKCFVLLIKLKFANNYTLFFLNVLKNGVLLIRFELLCI